MEKQRVAFLGPQASYTHQAALETFPSSSFELVPQDTVADVFKAVQSGAVFRGVVPFENSSNGTVTMTLDRFADPAKELQDILVCGEAYVDVRHCLVGRMPNDAAAATSKLETQASQGTQSQTGTSEEKHAAFAPIAPRVRKIYSHPQAWGQCERFLSTYLKSVERQDVSSTSKAAEIVAQENPPHTSNVSDPQASVDSAGTAAISSETAARIYGLDILAANIQDEASNMTRFFMICRQDPAEEPGSPIGARDGPSYPNSFGMATDPTQPIITSTTMDTSSSFAMGNPFSAPTYKTLISFTVPHTSPGALAKSLAVFADNGLNLTSINTRPSLIEPWNYLFFVEMLGRREEHGRGALNAALRALSGVARGWRWLGSWEMQVDTAGD